MNKSRRKRIEKIAEQLAELQSELESVRDDEQDAFDSMPEGLQYSERGDAIQEFVDDMDDAIGDFENIIETLNDIVER